MNINKIFIASVMLIIGSKNLNAMHAQEKDQKIEYERPYQKQLDKELRKGELQLADKMAAENKMKQAIKKTDFGATLSDEEIDKIIQDRGLESFDDSKYEEWLYDDVDARESKIEKNEYSECNYEPRIEEVD